MNRTMPLLMTCALAAGTAAASDDGWRGDPGRGYGRDYDVGTYAGLSFGQLRYNEEGLDTITPATGMFIVGASVSPNLAIEGRIGAGLGSSATNGYGINVNSLYAGYLKGSLPLSPGFSLYGLAGVAGVDYKRDFGLIDAHDTGFSYGLGMNFDLAGNTRLNVEWARLASGDNLGYVYNVDQAAIGLVWRF
ncbi:MAG: porin family protein [Gammaproteobacteria bacterium]|nr:porin family protein [Gammaproteobacteria bacterium]